MSVSIKKKEERQRKKLGENKMEKKVEYEWIKTFFNYTISLLWQIQMVIELLI